MSVLLLALARGKYIAGIAIQMFLVGISLFYPIYPTPPLGQDMTQGQFLSGV